MLSFNDPVSVIIRARNGQPQALGELYIAYSDLIFRYCYARLHDSEAAQDCTQEVFIRMWKGIKTFEYRGEFLLTAWMYTIANHVVVSHIRKRRRTPSTPLTPELGLSIKHDVDVASSVCDRLALRQALSQLTTEQQHVITLKFFVGLSNKEIAAVVRRSEGAVKALQYRAIARLHELLMPPQATLIQQPALPASL